MATTQSNIHANNEEEEQGVLKYRISCPSCKEMAEMIICEKEIPYFSLVIMTLACNHCDFKSTDVKPARSADSLAIRITLTITCEEDYKREVLKSDVAGVRIPELDLELTQGGISGCFTTVEGILQRMFLGLSSAFVNNPDFDTFLQRFKKYRDADPSILPFQLIIDDPLGHSYIGPIPCIALKKSDDDENIDLDPNLQVERYTRDAEQDDRIGRTREEGYKHKEEVDNFTRGADHPLNFTKGTLENDKVPMGSDSQQYPDPSYK